MDTKYVIPEDVLSSTLPNVQERGEKQTSSWNQDYRIHQKWSTVLPLNLVSPVRQGKEICNTFSHENQVFNQQKESLALLYAFSNILSAQIKNQKLVQKYLMVQQ